jgi:hemoglobin
MSTDLDSRTQIHNLVVSFYREIVFDDLLGPVFEEAAEVDWTLHLPKLVDYWCRVLLDQPGYDGYLLGPHQRVHELEPFRHEHFDRWYTLWTVEVDHQWAGPIADTAKRHAARVAETLARRVAGIDWSPPAT